MNDQESAIRIWQPDVNPTNEPVPYPGINQSNGGDERVYTKTSLDHEHERANDVRTLNSKIIRASESFNSTARPFSRQNTLPASLFPQQTNSSYPKPDISQESSAPDDRRKFPLQQSSSISNHHSHLAEGYTDAANTTDMAPKLVHNLYNSPMNLYSMNNIRKTIEAHSELIAPGVKGINFSKLDTPINKQSEVYKLVMEEEQHQHQHRKSPQRSPIGEQQQQQQQQQVKSTSSIEQARYRTCVAEHRAATVGSNQRSTIVPPHDQSQKMDNWSLPRPNYTDSRQQSMSNSSQSSSKPKCCECGQFIVGPFARIQNRNVHPHCFNCTTCGTSLKNTGYFTINDKLYCDIHAKQVANLMQINYNFASTSPSNAGRHHQHDGTSMKQYTRVERQESTRYQDSGQDLREQSATNIRDLDNATTTRTTGNTTRPVTISTMFANCSTSSTSRDENCCDGRQVRWTWRPANENQQTSSAHDAAFSTSYANATRSTVDSSHGFRVYHRGDTSGSQRDDSHDRSINRGVHHGDDKQALDSHQGGSKIPVCNHCRSQIRGPYILAGETTWCKPCSMNHFVCYNCNRSLLSIGFIEDNNQRYFCEPCYETYASLTCSKCNTKIRGDCLNALGKHWHPECFVCGHCHRQFGNSSFYLEDNVPYCQPDWNMLFTSKCYSCTRPIEAGDKWVEALDRNYHSQCFRCSSCGLRLEGSTFYCKNGKPYCKLHAR